MSGNETEVHPPDANQSGPQERDPAAPPQTKIPKRVDYDERQNKPVAKASWFTRFNGSAQVYMPDAVPSTIEVLPDERFVFKFIGFNVLEAFQTLDIKVSTIMTPLSYTAYCMAGFNASLLFNDRDKREPQSLYAQAVTVPTSNQALIQALEQMVIPDWMTPVIDYMGPLYEPRRHNLKYVPSLAAAVQSYDFGRLIPIYSLLSGHNILVNEPQVNNPQAMLNQYYAAVISTQAAPAINIVNANLYGTNYLVNGNVQRHPNWVNEMISLLFSPPTARNMLRRPNIGPVNARPYSFNAPADWNPYIYTLGLQPQNIQALSSFINDVSSFVLANKLGSKRLIDLIRSEASGSMCCNHFTSHIMLPTFGVGLIPQNIHQANVQYEIRTDAEFAEDIHFAPDRPALPVPATPVGAGGANCRPGFYMRHNAAFDPDHAAVVYDEFTDYFSVYPEAILYLPYLPQPDLLAPVTSCGLHIENTSIVGVAAPVPMAQNPPAITNSQFLQGSICLTYLTTPGTGIGDNVPIPYPEALQMQGQDIAYFIRTMRHHVLPQFAGPNGHYPAALADPPRGFDIQIGFCDHRDAANVHAYATTEDQPNLEPNYLTVWSSYRYRSRESRNVPADIRAFFSMEAIYGTNVTIGRSLNPASILPNRP